MKAQSLEFNLQVFVWLVMALLDFTSQVLVKDRLHFFKAESFCLALCPCNFVAEVCLCVTKFKLSTLKQLHKFL